MANYFKTAKAVVDNRRACESGVVRIHYLPNKQIKFIMCIMFIYYFVHILKIIDIFVNQQGQGIIYRMERHPQNKVQDDLYDKMIDNLKELNANVERMNQLLSETNKTNETAVLVSQLNSSYLDSISFQLDLQRKENEKDKKEK